MVKNLHKYQRQAVNFISTIQKYNTMHIPAVFRIRLQLNPDPDPANNLNPDPDPEDLESGSGFKLFLNTIIIFLLLLHNYQIFSSKKVN